MAPHPSFPPAGPSSAGRLSASRSRIDLWLTDYGRIEDEALLSDMRQLLSPAEREQCGRFRLADDCKRYLVTRAMVRTVLSRHAALAPADWAFRANEQGRPEIANPSEEAAGLQFNLSHTRGLIALAVTRHRNVGVDVEHLRARPAPLDIADRCFSRMEAAALAALPAEQRHERFFEYWTLKESYIKARGQGLSIPLDRFSFTFPQAHTVQFGVDPALHDDAHRWSFWQMRPSPDHLLALCAERLHDDATRLRVRGIVPLQGEECLELAVLKASEGARAR